MLAPMEKEQRFIYAKNDVGRIIEKIIESYQKAYGDKLWKIFLYGSYARGDYSKDSDLDLVAIVRAERNLVQDKLDQIWDVSSDLELEYEIIVSPTAIPYDDFMTYKDILPYYRNIEREGVLLNESA